MNHIYVTLLYLLCAIFFNVKAVDYENFKIISDSDIKSLVSDISREYTKSTQLPASVQYFDNMYSIDCLDTDNSVIMSKNIVCSDHNLVKKDFFCDSMVVVASKDNFVADMGYVDDYKSILREVLRRGMLVFSDDNPHILDLVNDLFSDYSIIEKDDLLFSKLLRTKNDYMAVKLARSGEGVAIVRKSALYLNNKDMDIISNIDGINVCYFLQYNQDAMNSIEGNFINSVLRDRRYNNIIVEHMFSKNLS